MIKNLNEERNNDLNQDKYLTSMNHVKAKIAALKMIKFLRYC